MGFFTVSAFAVSVLAAAMAAQVSPVHFQNSLGGASFREFGRGRGTRQLQVHDDIPANTTIRSISFRLLRSSASQPRDVVVSLTMSHAATTAATIQPTYAQNHGAGRTVVLRNQRITLPNVSRDAELPGDFRQTVILPTPFVYRGGASLCWELDVVPVTPTVDSIDAFQSSFPNFAMVERVRGRGCQSVRGREFTLRSSSSQWVTPTSFQTALRATNGPANTFGLLFVGRNDLVPFLDTVSGNSGLCTLYIRAVVIGPAVFGPTRDYWTRLRPANVTAALHGSTVAAQVLGFDNQANVLGGVTSNAYEFHLVAPYAKLPVSSVTGLSGALSGAAQRNAGWVVEFR